MAGEIRETMGKFKLFDVVRLRDSKKYKAMGVPEGIAGTIVDIVSDADVCTVEFCNEDGAAYGTCLSEYFTAYDLIFISRPWSGPTA